MDSRCLYNGEPLRIDLSEAIVLLEKFTAERTPVVAAFVSAPCNSTARITGLVRLESIGEMIALLVIGEDDQASDQIRFRLSDCTFEYGDFEQSDGPRGSKRS